MLIVFFTMMPPRFMLIFFTPSFVVSGIHGRRPAVADLHNSTHPPQRCSNDYRDIERDIRLRPKRSQLFVLNAQQNAFHRRDARRQSRSFVIRLCYGAGNVIETHEHGTISKSYE